jgi:hypothetical protein
MVPLFHRFVAIVVEEADSRRAQVETVDGWLTSLMQLIDPMTV